MTDQTSIDETTKSQEINGFLSAMRGKQMDERTFGTSFYLYSSARNILERACKDEPTDKSSELMTDEKFDSALKGASVVAAIGRDEESMTPADLLELMFKSLIGVRDERGVARAKLYDMAIANIQNDKNIMPFTPKNDGDEFPLPFNIDGLMRIAGVSILGGVEGTKEQS